MKILGFLQVVTAVYFQTKLADQSGVCSKIQNPSNAHYYTFFLANKIYQPIFDKWVKQQPTLTPFLQGQSTMQEYIFKDNLSFWIFFSVLFSINLVMCIGFYPYAINRQCCKRIKRDTTRTDYKRQGIVQQFRYEKVIPIIWFTSLSIIMLITTGYLVYQAWNIEFLMYSANCRLAQFVDLVNYGDNQTSWVGVQSLPVALYQFQQSYQKAQTTYTQLYQTQIQDMTTTGQNLNQTIANLYADYNGQLVPNFEANVPSTSPLQIFETNVWGPQNVTNTNTQKFESAMMNLVGFRLNAVPSMKVQGIDLSVDTGQVNQLSEAAAVVTQYQIGGQQYQNTWVGIIYSFMQFTPNFWISVYVYLSVSMVVICISILVITCLLITDQRRWKNIAHISWINSTSLLICSTLFAGCLSFGVIFLTDFCYTLEQQSNNKTVSGLDYLYPPNLQPFLNTCLYGNPSLAQDLKIDVQASTYDSMNYDSTSYLYSTQLDQAKQYDVLTDEQLQLQNFINYPTNLKFDVNYRLITTQPAEQLEKINQMTDLSSAQNKNFVCDSAKDQIVETTQNCAQNVPVIQSTSGIPIQYLGQNVCLVLRQLNQNFFNARYSNTANCQNAKTAINQFYNFWNSLSPGLLSNAISGIGALNTQIQQANNLLQTTKTQAVTLSASVAAITSGFQGNVTAGMDCQVVRLEFDNYQRAWCTDLRSGMIDIMIYTYFLIPICLLMAICGLQVVMRSKVDVPNYNQLPKQKLPTRRCCQRQPKDDDLTTSINDS